ncbi:MAG: hypothetical protein EGP82_03340 [Odoribacter splanchnicus]|nr:hypothetical protein [Odoribacter splanchnicus]MBD9178198.1 hypothetical protein [Odoribacter splanchnicus]
MMQTPPSVYHRKVALNPRFFYKIQEKQSIRVSRCLFAKYSHQMTHNPSFYSKSIFYIPQDFPRYLQ